jgi:hypothetical protein
MMRSALIVSVFLVNVLVAGCSSAKTRIMPKADGSYLMVASDRTESGAYDAAVDKSTEYCKQQGKGFVMTSQNSSYHGMNKDAKAATNLVSEIYGAATHDRMTQYEMNGQTSSIDDNKVEMVFNCK